MNIDVLKVLVVFALAVLFLLLLFKRWNKRLSEAKRLSLLSRRNETNAQPDLSTASQEELDQLRRYNAPIISAEEKRDSH